MMRRSKEKAKPATNMNEYYAVIGFFCACMFGALIYTVMNPSTSFAQMPVLDESAMLVHNGQSHRFTQATNEFFTVSQVLSFAFVPARSASETDCEANLDILVLIDRTGRLPTRRSSSKWVCLTTPKLNSAARVRTSRWSSPRATTGVRRPPSASRSLLLAPRTALPATSTLLSPPLKTASARMARNSR